jgi:predicted DNA-binding transcriptional regulator YafY
MDIRGLECVLGSDKAVSRAIRLTQIQHLLNKKAGGLTTKELATFCGTGVRTIQRDIKIIQNNLGIPLVKLGYDRWGIRDVYYLPSISFSLFEAVALFLASRLVARETDESNPHVLTALSKLSRVLPSEVASPIEQSILEIARKPTNPQYIRVFERVAVAWITQRRIKVLYQSLRSDTAKEWIIDPYFIEMTGVGYSTYVIGRAESTDRQGITTFKLDRIKEIELLPENFEIPEDIKIGELLTSSWGVIWGEDIELELKFSPSVTRRVKESVWHPSQIVVDLPDGGCILKLKVGSLLEITPWIRSWGPDVEVIAPAELREKFSVWVNQLYDMYCQPEK